MKAVFPIWCQYFTLSTGPFSWFVRMSNPAGCCWLIDVLTFPPGHTAPFGQSSPHQEMLWFSPLGCDGNWKLISVSAFVDFLYSCLSSSSQDINATCFVTGEKVKAADSASTAGKLQHFKVGGMDVGVQGLTRLSQVRKRKGWMEGGELNRKME